MACEVIKSEDELDNLRKAAELADYAIEVGCREIAEGKTELEILMAIEFEMKKKGVQKMSFDTMVLSGPKTLLHTVYQEIEKSKKVISFYSILVLFIMVIVQILHEQLHSVNRQKKSVKFMKQ